MTHDLRASAAFPVALLVMATCTVPSCKPQAPDLHAQRRPAASARAEAAKAAIESTANAAKQAAGLTDEQAAAVVARVGERTITLGDVAAYVARLPRSARSRYVTPEQRLELVQHMVEVELLAREGEGRGFGTDPVVQHSYKKALANELLRTVTSDRSLGDIKPAEVEAYYAAHKADFVRAERRRCAVIYFDTKEDTEAAARGLEAAIAATPKASKQIFGDWAREKSVDLTSGKLKGDLGWFDEKGLNEKGQNRVTGRLLEVVYAMESVHQVSAAVELESRQWLLAQITGIEAAREAPLADVRLEIQNALLRASRTEAREAFIAELRAKATIDVDEAALAALPAPEPEPGVKVPKVAKPKFNPALFRRRVNTPIAVRPGAEKPGLKLDRGPADRTEEARQIYLGPGQGGGDKPETPGEGAP